MPRIDTMRNHIMATIELLEMALADLETLHSLAYDRSHAHEQIRIRGGLPDYSLDRHGDPVARAAYKELLVHLQRGRDSIGAGAQAAIRAVELHGPKNLDNTQFQSRISAEELLRAIEAQDRRIQRGDYTPSRQYRQPTIAGLEKSLRRQITALRKENAALHRKLSR